MKLLDFEQLQEKIDGIAEYDFSNHKVFGSAYWVYQDGKTFERCYGTEGLNSSTPITAFGIHDKADHSGCNVDSRGKGTAVA